VLDDNELLNFDTTRSAMADAGDARGLLHKHGDVFRAQLVAARWLESYLERRPEERQAIMAGSHTQDHEEGFEKAMRDLIAHLRQVDLLPGARLYEDEQERSLNG